MAFHTNSKTTLNLAPLGGLKNAEQFLGLRDIKGFVSLDVIFISIDLEVSRQERRKTGIPSVKQFGIATLDTRHLKSQTSLSAPSKIISTLQFSTSHASKDFVDCDVTDFKECVFVETFLVSQLDLAATVTKYLCIKDTKSPDSHSLRNIVIVGHSPQSDLKVLQRLGVDVCKILPLRAVIDTYSIAQNFMGANSDLLKESAPMTRFTLGDLLEALKCPFGRYDLHNAGNDATFTLHALLLLAIKSSESRDMISSEERVSLERLRALVQAEVYECERWSPTRAALGCRALEFPT